jgi:hypothetical protein
MELECLGVGEDFITVEVKNKATLFERKGVLIPGAIIDLPAGCTIAIDHSVGERQGRYQVCGA